MPANSDMFPSISTPWLRQFGDFPLRLRCPECGGSLYAEFQQWDSEAGLVDIDACEIGCVDEDDDPDYELGEDWHQYYQCDWQPVIDDAREWLKDLMKEEEDAGVRISDEN